MRIIIIIAFSLLFYHCFSLSCSNNSEYNYRIEAERKYGEDNTKYSFNFDSTFVLVINQKETTNLNPFPLLKFFIFDLNKNKLVYEEILPNAKAEWINKNQVEIIIIPEVVTNQRDNKKSGYIFDLELNKKIKLINSK